MMNNREKTGVLYLVPSPLSEGVTDSIPVVVSDRVRGIKDFIVERERTARRFLSRIVSSEILDACSFRILDEHTDHRDIELLLEPVLSGRDMALISEAGCPCIADPGSPLVLAAHARSIRVIPLSGPSSILMGLMASGLSGQSFCFNGYLPQEQGERRKALVELERETLRSGRTQICIETPYRTQAFLSDALEVLNPETVFCTATGLSSSTETIHSMTIAAWRATNTMVSAEPTVFVFGPRPQEKGNHGGTKAGPSRPLRNLPSRSSR